MRSFLFASTAAATMLAASAVAASITPFTYTGTFQTFTTQAIGIYDILAYGAQGGTGNVFTPMPGGLGAEIGGDFLLTAGQTLSIRITTFMR